MKRLLVLAGLLTAAAALSGPVPPTWLTEGVLYRYRTADGAKAESLKAVRALGVTLVDVGPSPLAGADLADYRAKAEELGLRLIEAKDVERDAARPWNAAVRAVLDGKRPASSLAQEWDRRHAPFPSGPRRLYCNPLQNDPVGLSFAFALDGLPAVEAFHENGQLALVKELCRLRTSLPALNRGTVVWLPSDAPSVVAVLREAPDGGKLVCAFNFATNAVRAHVSVPEPLAETSELSRSVASVSADGDYVFEDRGFDFRWLPASRAAERAIASRRRPPKGTPTPPNPVYDDIPARTAKSAPDFLRSSVLYQLFLRPFTAAGTFKAAEERLPFLKETGVDVIYLAAMAQADDGDDVKYWSGRQVASKLGNPCNPYRVKDYFAIDPEYGTPEDFERFVAAAHRLGLKVLYDLVYYHCGPNSKIFREHPGWIRRDKDGSLFKGPWRFPVLKMGSVDLREYLFANMTYLMERYKLDGFRCDVGSTVPISFWEEGRRRCEMINPDMIMLCEGRAPESQFAAFDLNYGFQVQKTLENIQAGRTNANALAESYRACTRMYPKGFRFMRCIENHDIVNVGPGGKSPEAKYGATLCESMLATVFLLDGLPMIYNGQEVADDAPHSIWSNRFYGGRRIDWGRAFAETGRKRRAFVRRLVDLRHRHPDLFDAPVDWLPVGDPDKVYAFRRKLKGGDLLLVVNVTDKDVTTTVDGVRRTLSSHGHLIEGE